MNKINSIYGARKPPQEYEIDVNTPSGCKEEEKKCEKKSLSNWVVVATVVWGQKEALMPPR